jgi:ferredoxin
MDDDPSARSESTSRRRRARLQRLKLKRRRRKPSRRSFMFGGVGLAASGVALDLLSRVEGGPIARADRAPMRPPSADADDLSFQQKCIRCGLCGTVCENGCIRFFSLGESKHGSLTPYLDLRQRSCTLCMRCTQVCPTGALSPIEDETEAIVANVDMGKAVVERDLCLSYLGRVCGYCHDACPIPNRAIRLTPPALPVVLDECVGCGRCVEFCPQSPTAISVVRTEKA